MNLRLPFNGTCVSLQGHMYGHLLVLFKVATALLFQFILLVGELNIFNILNLLVFPLM